MERKGDYGIEEVEKKQSSNTTISGDEGVLEIESDEGLSILKREIACHSLYSQLVQSHLDCLKLCLGKLENIDSINVIDPTIPHQNGIPTVFEAHPSELDQFMEAYCTSLNKVKETVEETQQESMAFINHMYSQLQDLHFNM